MAKKNRELSALPVLNVFVLLSSNAITSLSTGGLDAATTVAITSSTIPTEHVPEHFLFFY